MLEEVNLYGFLSKALIEISFRENKIEETTKFFENCIGKIKANDILTAIYTWRNIAHILFPNIKVKASFSKAAPNYYKNGSYILETTINFP